MKDLLKYFTHKKAKLIPVLILVFLGLATYFTLTLTKTSRELRSKAALTDTATLTLSPTTVNSAPNGTFTMNVIFNSGNLAAVGADILVDFDETKLTLLTISPVNHAVYKTYAPVVSPAPACASLTTSNLFNSTKVITDANQKGFVEFGVVSFDWCGDGGAGSLTSPAPGTVISPIAIMTFQVKTGATGSSTIEFIHVSKTKYQSSYVDTTDSNVVANPAGGGDPEDILIAPTSTATVTITSAASPTPSPSASPGAITVCEADINQSGTVDVSDYSILRGNIGKTVNEATNPRADVNRSGMIDVSDYSILRGYLINNPDASGCTP